MTDVVTVLRDARALLARPGGWCKGKSEIPTNRGYDAYCIVGALVAAGLDTLEYSALEVIRVLVPGYPSLSAFNDAPSTRKRNVLNLLDRAIAQAERPDLKVVR